MSAFLPPPPGSRRVPPTLLLLLPLLLLPFAPAIAGTGIAASPPMPAPSCERPPAANRSASACRFGVRHRPSPPPVASASRVRSAPPRPAPATPLLPLLLALLVLSALGGLLARRLDRRLFPAARAWRLLRREIRAQERILRIRRLQLVATDPYGSADLSRWEREKRRFCRTRLLPILRRAGLVARWPALENRALRRIERVARRPVPAAQAAPAFSPAMDPSEYERLCARLLRRAGWDARVCGGSGDQGADILATRTGRTLVVQCKRYGGAVGNAAVQEASAARLHHRADLAAVVSNARFTASARRLAATNAVFLLHHEELIRFRPVAGTGRSGR